MQRYETTVEIPVGSLTQTALRAISGGGDCPLYSSDLIEVDVVVTYCPGGFQPAKLYGEPENCCPEASWPAEIQSVMTSRGRHSVELDAVTLAEVQGGVNEHDEELRRDARQGACR